MIYYADDVISGSTSCTLHTLTPLHPKIIPTHAASPVRLPGVRPVVSFPYPPSLEFSAGTCIPGFSPSALKLFRLHASLHLHWWYLCNFCSTFNVTTLSHDKGPLCIRSTAARESATLNSRCLPGFRLCDGGRPDPSHSDRRI